MNNTNRVVNRTILFVLGVVLLAIGAGVATSAIVPAVGDAWGSVGSGIEDWATGAVDATTIAGTRIAWVVVGLLAALLLLIVLLITIVVRSIHGRRRTALSASGSADDLGRITVTEGFASAALKNALADRDEILSARVAAGEVKREPVLHLSITPRQNTSPLQVAQTAERLVSNLAVLTGSAPATYVSLHAGLRARLAHDQRRLS